jgi:putative SOS response-associated peptidase YedK
MCGRFTLRTPVKDVAAAFDVPAEGLADSLPLFTHFNIAPTQQVVAVRADPSSGSRQLVPLRWGLVPSWADDPAIGNRMINARADTVASKPSFRAAFKSRRCLIAADGFYEWQKRGASKQPYFIGLRDEGPFAFAGLWERWRRDDQTIESCTIITTEANELMRPLHDRMPVILPREDYASWLDPRPDRGEALQKLLQPYAPARMTAYPVSTIVNNPRNDVPQCIEPLAATNER